MGFLLPKKFKVSLRPGEYMIKVAQLDKTLASGMISC